MVHKGCAEDTRLLQCLWLNNSSSARLNRIDKRQHYTKMLIGAGRRDINKGYATAVHAKSNLNTYLPDESMHQLSKV